MFDWLFLHYLSLIIRSYPTTIQEAAAQEFRNNRDVVLRSGVSEETEAGFVLVLFGLTLLPSSVRHLAGWGVDLAAFLRFADKLVTRNPSVQDIDRWVECGEITASPTLARGYELVIPRRE